MSETKPKPRVLIVDFNERTRAATATALASFDLPISQVETGSEALDKMAEAPFDIVLLEVNLPDMDGIEVLDRIRASYPQTLVLMITDLPSIEGTTTSIQLGALDYLVRPFRGEVLCKLIANALDKFYRQETEGRSARERGQDPLEEIIGKSPAIRELKSKLEKVSATESTVLITGESGTGKDLIAKTIHGLSQRARNDFIPVDCSALVESLLESELFGHVKGAFTGADGNKLGLFELANQGTFFFDEISNLSYNIQCKLLRVIQEREFRKVGSQKRQQLDIRILCASNRDLMKAVEKGTFRNDLYYRINVVPIHLPPLRERSEDIPLLLDHFFERHRRHTCGSHNGEGFSEEALEMLTSYPWPGNVRELQHLVEQLLVLGNGDLIRPEHLPTTVAQRRGVFNIYAEDLPLEEMEKRYIRFILHRTRGIRQQAANILGINRKTLAAKIKKYGL